MTYGFAPPPASDPSHRLARILEPAEWATAGIPLLSNPRVLISGLHARHTPTPATAVIAVLHQDGRLAASASFRQHGKDADGWELRNGLLARLRRIIPHDLRLRAPVRTAVLLYCREGDGGWTVEDGAWMWGLRDACTLHGLRCGAYIAMTPGGWHVLGDGRHGRRPHTGSPSGPLIPDGAGTSGGGGTRPSRPGAVPANPRHTAAC